ncbi:MAG: ABC transporter permease [Acidobacteria bacterium]|nr:ABC transporter permease [Acidobacteriota bacterium]
MRTRRAVLLLGTLAGAALLAPWLAPYDPSASFRGFRHAPPMPPRLSEGLQAHPLRRESLLDERFVEDRTRVVPLPWSRDRTEPVFLLGADASGRDVLSRLLAGTRVSLGLALVAVLGTTLVGSVLGAWAGAAGGRLDEVMMRTADFVLVLPVLYVVLVLRAAMPLVLPSAVVFTLMAGIFIAVGWPVVARGVRGIVARERDREYAVAARSLGAGTMRVLVRHLLPACGGHVAVQASLLLPAFVLAEATLSFVGLGFPATQPSWGTMLRDAADVNELTRFPWVLAPAFAIIAVTLTTNLALQPRTAERPLATDASPIAR